MTTANKTRMDTAEWKQAMSQYGTMARMTPAEVFQQKGGRLFYEARDIMVGPHGNNIAKREDILRVISQAKFVSWYCNQVFGVGQWGRSEWYEVQGGRHDRPGEDVAVSEDKGSNKRYLLTRRLSSVKFMYSILSKMGARVADRKVPFASKFPQVRAFRDIKKASLDKFQVIITGQFGSGGGKDATYKRLMLNRAITKAEPIVLADMQKYITRKFKAWAGIHGNM